jgi:hypothetical protein
VVLWVDVFLHFLLLSPWHLLLPKRVRV